MRPLSPPEMKRSTYVYIINRAAHVVKRQRRRILIERNPWRRVHVDKHGPDECGDKRDAVPGTMRTTEQQRGLRRGVRETPVDC